MFRDQYPDIAVSEQLYVIDRDRITCAGGVATLDLMCHLIARRHGPGLAQIVANGVISARAPPLSVSAPPGAPAALAPAGRRSSPTASSASASAAMPSRRGCRRSIS